MTFCNFEYLSLVWAGRPVLAFAVVPLSQCFSASSCLFPSGHAFPIQASHLCFFLSHVGQLFPSNLNPPLASSLRSAQSQQRFCRFGHLSLRCLILLCFLQLSDLCPVWPFVGLVARSQRQISSSSSGNVQCASDLTLKA